MSLRLALVAAVLASSVMTVATHGLVAPKPRPVASGPATASAPAPANQFSFTGKITTGMMAIGGETTGTTISDGKTTYELDIKDAVMKRKAEELAGKDVTVKGVLTVKAGIEVGQRRIITVESLAAAAAK